MKKQILLIILMLLPIVAIAQTQSAVTLKNGTVLKGIVKSIDPTTSVKMEIGGIETTINMTDVAKIETIEEDNDDDDGAPDVVDDAAKLTVTDRANYPETFELKVGEHSIKMLLVRGGDMNMGYDGRHSLKYKSEPVHKVRVTSFYMSEGYIPIEIAANLVDGIKIKDNPYYSSSRYESLQQVVEAIAEASQVPVRIPTEAEWEFAACSQQQHILFSTCNDLEVCSDWFAPFVSLDYATDPTGPSKGRNHVTRSFSRMESKFFRIFVGYYGFGNKRYARLVVKARDIVR